jgi:hypothetical protein
MCRRHALAFNNNKKYTCNKLIVDSRLMHSQTFSESEVVLHTCIASLVLAIELAVNLGNYFLGL